MIILDTSGLLAALDRRAAQHLAARRALETASSSLILSPFVLAELDYLVSHRIGAHAMRPVLQDVADEVYELVELGPDDVASAAEVMERYADLDIGLTDASLVVVADRYDTSTLLTLDERHFRTVKSLSGAPFALLPADASDG